MPAWGATPIDIRERGGTRPLPDGLNALHCLKPIDHAGELCSPEGSELDAAKMVRPDRHRCGGQIQRACHAPQALRAARDFDGHPFPRCGFASVTRRAREQRDDLDLQPHRLGLLPASDSTKVASGPLLSDDSGPPRHSSPGRSEPRAGRRCRCWSSAAWRSFPCTRDIARGCRRSSVEQRIEAPMSSA